MIDTASRERLAATAQSLLANEAFAEALAVIRADALEDLATATPTDLTAVTAAQARVRVVDDIRVRIGAMIRAVAPGKKPGIA